jgi:hypothetical protein
MTDVQSWLNNSNYETHTSFKFKEVGDKIRGEIVAEPRIVNTEDLNGGSSDKLVLDIRAEADGETYSVWVKKGLMGKAIAAAVKEAGATQLLEGGTLGIAHTGIGQPSKPGFNPPKFYQASYKPPAAGVNPDDIFGS